MAGLRAASSGTAQGTLYKVLSSVADGLWGKRICSCRRRGLILGPRRSQIADMEDRHPPTPIGVPPLMNENVMCCRVHTSDFGVSCSQGIVCGAMLNALVQFSRGDVYVGFGLT